MNQKGVCRPAPATPVMLMTSWVLIRGAPYPPDPPMGGGLKYVFGVITDGPFRPTKNQIFLTSNITWAILGEYPLTLLSP